MWIGRLQMSNQNVVTNRSVISNRSKAGTTWKATCPPLKLGMGHRVGKSAFTDHGSDSTSGIRASVLKLVKVQMGRGVSSKVGHRSKSGRTIGTLKVGIVRILTILDVVTGHVEDGGHELVKMFTTTFTINFCRFKFNETFLLPIGGSFKFQNKSARVINYALLLYLLRPRKGRVQFWVRWYWLHW